MNDRLAALNRRLVQGGCPTLRHGIGIHTGEVLTTNGNFVL
ncbi:MAG: hypothetical protein U5R49_03005 [Deltaproteobacteria bacterium]|nr:hypothetical protein [Deltaproteobacteria bacterium]